MIAEAEGEQRVGSGERVQKVARRGDGFREQAAMATLVYLALLLGSVLLCGGRAGNGALVDQVRLVSIQNEVRLDFPQAVPRNECLDHRGVPGSFDALDVLGCQAKVRRRAVVMELAQRSSASFLPAWQVVDVEPGGLCDDFLRCHDV